MMSATALPMHHTGQGFTTVSHMMPPPTAPHAHIQNPLTSFLKGQPKALGTVQIMIGITTILFSIEIALTSPSVYIYSGVFFWGSMIHISAGALSVAAENNLNSCLVKACLTMNTISAVAAAVSILLMSADIELLSSELRYAFRNYPYERYEYHTTSDIFNMLQFSLFGNRTILLVFSVVEMIISICISAYSCKSVCCAKPTVAYSAGVNIQL